MKRKLTLCLIFLCGFFVVYGQGKVYSSKEAEAQGYPYQRLDAMYKSALHANVVLAVFQTPKEQEDYQKAYLKFMADLNAFLKSHNFSWGKQTSCFNRIYFNSNGVVDYFLYTFSKDQITPEKEKEFDGLLKLFIQSHKFSMTASEKFAQCGPVRYN